MSLLDYSKPNTPTIEAYRGVRSNIQFSNVDEDIKVILVTSTQPGEGKSTFLSNLAVNFAHLDEKKILLVDGDLRKPTIHKNFGLSNSIGITDVLKQNKKLEDCIKHMEGIDIITAGSIPPNPSEILGSKKMKSFISELKEKYDYIFIDSPPIGVVSDAQVIASISDGAILLIGYGEVERYKAKLAKEKLENSNVKILGAVINKGACKNKSDYYYEEKKYKKISKHIVNNI